MVRNPDLDEKNEGHWPTARNQSGFRQFSKVETNKQTNGDAQSGLVFEINWKFIIIKIIIIIIKK